MSRDRHIPENRGFPGTTPCGDPMNPMPFPTALSGTAPPPPPGGDPEDGDGQRC